MAMISKIEANDAELKELMKGIKVVDTDTHISEWPDLWTSRATPKYKELVPQVRIIDGKEKWIIGDHVMAANNGFSAITKDGAKSPGIDFFDLTYGEIFEGGYDLKARLAYLDREGIAAQIGYTNLLGFGGVLSQKIDRELRLVSLQIQNDAMAQMQEESGNRIYPMAMVPWWDIELAVKEIERCADMGLRGINTNGTPEDHGMPDLGGDYWNPLWEVCVDRNLPVNFHIGFSEGQDKEKAAGWVKPGVWPSFAGYERYASSGAMLFTPNMQLIVNMLLSDIFERHPKLKVVSVESGVGWVPFMLEMLEYQIAENVAGHRALVKQQFQKHFFTCFWGEREGLLEYVRRVGADSVMFETDFPHPTCLYPSPLGYHIDTMRQLSREDREKVFGGNAVKLYNLDLSKASAVA